MERREGVEDVVQHEYEYDFENACPREHIRVEVPVKMFLNLLPWPLRKMEEERSI